jgi:hypothetical protein
VDPFHHRIVGCRVSFLSCVERMWISSSHLQVHCSSGIFAWWLDFPFPHGHSIDILRRGLVRCVTENVGRLLCAGSYPTMFNDRVICSSCALCCDSERGLSSSVVRRCEICHCQLTTALDGGPHQTAPTLPGHTLRLQGHYVSTWRVLNKRNIYSIAQNIFS